MDFPLISEEELHKNLYDKSYYLSLTSDKILF